MLFPITETNPPPMEKKAFDPVSTLVGMGLGDIAMKNIQDFGKARGANFLGAGIELGKKNEKMAPLYETVSRNMLGKRQLYPYEKGLEIGKKITEKGMDPEKEKRFINKVVNMTLSQDERLRAAGLPAKEQPNLINAMSDYGIGKEKTHPYFQKRLLEGSIPEHRKGTGGKIVGNLLTGALAYPVDFRFGIRPMVNKIEQHPKVTQTTEKLFPSGTARGKAKDIARNYID